MRGRAFVATAVALASLAAAGAGAVPVAAEAPPGWWPPAIERPVVDDHLRVRSPIGDFIGAGATDDWSLADWTIATSPAGDRLELMTGGAVDAPQFLLIGPIGQRLTTGTLVDLRSGNGYDEQVGGLRWWAHHRSCETPLAWVAIDDLVWQGQDVARVSLRFASRCEPGMPPALGSLTWSAPTSSPAAVRSATAPASGRAVVAAIYRDVLGRTVSSAELDGWDVRLRSGWSIARVAATIRRSDEGLRREADATYLVSDARPATPSERSAWTSWRRGGASIARARSIAITALPAPEGQPGITVEARWLDRVTFAVAQVHPVQTDGDDGCGPDTPRDLRRIACADRFQRTARARAAVVRQQFLLLLRRSPDPAGLRYWTDRLAAGVPEEDLTVGLLASSEYARRAAG